MQKIVFLKIENAIYKQNQGESRIIYFCTNFFFYQTSNLIL